MDNNRTEKQIVRHKCLFAVNIHQRITILDNPTAAPNHIECGNKAEPVSEWKVTNKQFSNIFVCTKCKKRFLGRVRIKKHFDYTKVKKSIVPITKKDNQKKQEEINSEVSV